MTTQQQTLKVQLVKSPIGTKESHRATVRGLGLRKLNSVSELQDTPTLHVHIDEAKIGALGITQDAVYGTLSSAWGSVYVNDFVDLEDMLRPTPNNK